MGTSRICAGKLESNMGGRSSRIEYVQDPKLVKSLEEAINANRKTQGQMNDMQKKFNAQVDALQKEKSEFMKELNKMKKAADKPKEDYNRIVKQAYEIVSGVSRKVAILVGAPGAGKSTICKHMFGIEDAVPGESSTHVTTELSLFQSVFLPYELVDTIGKMPDVRGIMRVIACAYARGWDPSALIAVDNSRSDTFNAAANFVGAGKINTIQFEPRTFWRMVNSGMDPNQALNLTVFTDPHGLPNVNSLTSNNMDVQSAAITEGLQSVLKDLTWEKSQQANDLEGIQYALAFYLAKSIVERHDFLGSDLDFISLN